MDQSTTPLVEALQRCAIRPNAAFHTPGHKRGQGITSRQQALFGLAAFQSDLPELPELDNLFAPEGVILQAQQLAAEAFGAQQTWFLANGSTCGIEAAILATCGPGDKIILPRNVHTSAIAGLILSGAVPIYISPPYSAEWNIPIGINAQAIATALNQHPDAKAVFLVSPTYEGICSNLKAIAQVVHTKNIPLIVDEAHGPHFAFHPALPASALAAGADIAVQSAHKVLSAFTQAAMLHTQGDRIDRNRLTHSLQLTQSSSPSYLLLGSLDAARYQMAIQGHTLLSQTIALAERAQNALEALPGISVLRPQGDRYSDSQYIFNGDCTRLTVNVSGLGLTGFEADDILHTQYAVTAELPTLSNLTFILSIGNTSADIDQLIDGFKSLCKSHAASAQMPTASARTPSVHTPSIHTPANTELAFSPISPRQAFFAAKTPLPTDQAIGKICAEILCPYPPGIPVLFPGEPITEGAIAYLQATLIAGGIVTGCNDPTLQTILTMTPPTPVSFR
mgnify:CR=1 FL=1